MAEPFRADVCSTRRDGAVLHVTGDIDQGNWVDVADRIAAEVRAGVLHLDLTRVSFFGAAGVRAVMHGRDAVPPGVTLQVSCAPMAFRAMQICGLLTSDRLRVTPAADGDAQPEAGA
ncbi:anti-anti-sigma regulatory factor [Krasilnikovia cinnamomea]|uniref:Anti-anti-sigma regulatory factor n=1 Tax=Krasilnikovia cinnamomea TaxID=349313 RepID=A0A4Q7ZPI6_9ACTN|nr:STAS domain-containing protein [Krasilnikovia cinnamomea]RZU52988.1 anti-anti-sigma regulatory factor [Krasilnikovia cinnamomea]